jgi:PAS domain S-box-containing protein
LREPVAEGGESATGRLRVVVGIAGGVYLAWWFMVELLLPGSFNPLPGRLVVVGLSGVLLGASYRSGWIAGRLPTFFTAWVCVLVGHYCYLLIGNHGESTWWVGAFVTFAAVSMCLSSRRDVLVFSLFALGCVVYAAAVEGQLNHSIYVPGLVTILLLANITKRSQMIAQEATLQADRARKESRRADEQRLQLAAIVEFSGDAIIASSLEGLIRSWNQGAERLFGYPANETIGRSIALLLPPGREGEEPALIARLAKGEPVASFETVRRQRDGGDVDVSVTISPIRDSRDDLVGVSLAARDISDRKRAQAEILRAREAAESANEELEAFSYSVAHDLRAPLRAIDGFSQALEEDCADKLDAEDRKNLERVRAAAIRMSQLIEGLLGLSRLGRGEAVRERVDLTRLAEQSLSRLREAHPERRVECVVEEGLAAEGDPRLLAAALDNLLGNAWKFTSKVAHAQIEIGRRVAEGHPAFFVCDNGAGFDQAYAHKLFGVFQRLHAATEFEGSGIGLATVQRIVRRHGGRIWAEGEVGRGATFYFTL